MEQLHFQATLFAQQGRAAGEETTDADLRHPTTGKGPSAEEWSRSPGSVAPPWINLTKSTCHSTKQ